MEEFVMASKYIMSRFYSNFYYPDEFRSSKTPATRDEVHHIGKVLKYKYKPTGEINESKKYFVDMLYDMELQRLKLEGVVFTKKNEKSLSKKIMKTCNNRVRNAKHRLD